MPLINVNGISMYYELEGKGEPLIFISGFSTHHEIWKPLARLFSKTHQTLIFDNRGSGQTDSPPPPYSIELMAKDTIALMDALDISKASFMGSSMGTAIIQNIALLFPKRIRKGVLIAPFARLPRPSMMFSETVAKFLEANVPFPLIVDSVLSWLYSNEALSNPEFLRLKREEMQNNPYLPKPEGYLGQLSALQSFDFQGKLSKISTKMLLIAGEEDLSTPLYCAKFLQKKLPSSVLKTFPRTGHMIHIEKQEEMFKVALDFILKNN